MRRNGQSPWPGGRKCGKIGHARRQPDAQTAPSRQGRAASANTRPITPPIGKADGLEGGELREALAHRLGQAVGGEEQDHEHAGQRDVAVDGCDVHAVAGGNVERHFLGDGLERRGGIGVSVVDLLAISAVLPGSPTLTRNWPVLLWSDRMRDLSI